MVGLLHLVGPTASMGGDLAQSPPRCTECNTSPINSQCIKLVKELHR